MRLATILPGGVHRLRNVSTCMTLVAINTPAPYCGRSATRRVPGMGQANIDEIPLKRSRANGWSSLGQASKDYKSFIQWTEHHAIFIT